MPLNPPSSEAKSLLSTKKERLHRMISQKISESATGLISSELLFALFKRFCKDEILLEKFSEFNESQVIPSFSTEDAILFVDQLLDFSASPLISSGPEESPAEEPPASEQPPQAVPVSKDAFVRQQETISEFHRQLEDVQHSLQRSKSINQSVRKENAEFQEEIFRLRKQLEAAGQTCQEPSAFLRDRIASLSASLEQRKGYVEQLETLISDVRADRVGSVPEKSIEQTLSRNDNAAILLQKLAGERVTMKRTIELCSDSLSSTKRLFDFIAEREALVRRACLLTSKLMGLRQEESPSARAAPAFQPKRILQLLVATVLLYRLLSACWGKVSIE